MGATIYRLPFLLPLQPMNKRSLKELLDEKTEQYNRPDFIENDPIKIPHLFSKKEDIEIIGFLTSIIAWGKRASIIKNAHKLIDLLDNSPHDFIMNFQPKDLKRCEGFVHRTFNSTDLLYFLYSLQNIYRNHQGLEKVFEIEPTESAFNSINNFRKVFFEIEHPQRTGKHISNPLKNSSAKRLNMFLRWMVRKDTNGVDFGIWNSLSPSQLFIPLDVHTGNVGRKLQLLKRKQDDWKAVEELTAVLKEFDPKDPVKYDFALFGMGVSGEF